MRRRAGAQLTGTTNQYQLPPTKHDYQPLTTTD
jgi:hypothetical protein